MGRRFKPRKEIIENMEGFCVRDVFLARSKLLDARDEVNLCIEELNVALALMFEAIDKGDYYSDGGLSTRQIVAKVNDRLDEMKKQNVIKEVGWNLDGVEKRQDPSGLYKTIKGRRRL